jgi:hypothetical protein
MRHLDVAIFGTATAVLIALIMLLPTKARPHCGNGAAASLFTNCRTIR